MKQKKFKRILPPKNCFKKFGCEPRKVFIMTLGTGHEVQVFSNVIGPYYIGYSISHSSDISQWTTGEDNLSNSGLQIKIP